MVNAMSEQAEATGENRDALKKKAVWTTRNVKQVDFDANRIAFIETKFSCDVTDVFPPDLRPLKLHKECFRWLAKLVDACPNLQVTQDLLRAAVYARDGGATIYKCRDQCVMTEDIWHIFETIDTHYFDIRVKKQKDRLLVHVKEPLVKADPELTVKRKDKVKALRVVTRRRIEKSKAGAKSTHEANTSVQRQPVSYLGNFDMSDYNDWSCWMFTFVAEGQKVVWGRRQMAMIGDHLANDALLALYAEGVEGANTA